MDSTMFIAQNLISRDILPCLLSKVVNKTLHMGLIPSWNMVILFYLSNLNAIINWGVNLKLVIVWSN